MNDAQRRRDRPSDPSDAVLTCASGLAPLLIEDLTRLGLAGETITDQAVRVLGGSSAAHRALLYGCVASRALWPIVNLAAGSDQALYESAVAVDWEAHFEPDASLDIEASGANQAFRHTGFVAQRIKDAIADRMRTRFDVRPTIDADAVLRLVVHVHRQQATVYVDLGGGALHRRGWRVAQAPASLRETLAAAVLLRAGWPAVDDPRPLLDPCAGAGTLVIEGCLLRLCIAPQWQRPQFGVRAWLGAARADFEAQLRDARAQAEQALAASDLLALACEPDPAAREGLMANLHGAKLVERVRVQAAPVARARFEPAALLVSNPPYGERIADQEQAARVLSELGQAWAAQLDQTPGALLLSASQDARDVGARYRSRHAFDNGGIDCWLYRYDPPSQWQAPRSARTLPALDAATQMLLNRLNKNETRLRSWRKREAVEAWRLYDADLPEYAAAIDLYGAQAHVQEYQAPASIAKELARERLRQICVALRHYGLASDAIVVKQRRRQKRGDQYAATDAAAEPFVINEGGLKFEVELKHHLDSGLFIDHRIARALVRAWSSGADVLNLYAYTASVAVYAAAGQARSTLSIDWSNTYLDWAARNFALNGIDPRAHRLLRADVWSWLQAANTSYDLIFLDPPSFSNSTRSERTLDIQRDHEELIRLTAACLRRHGLLLFSTNLRRFKLEPQLLADYDVVDLSAPSISPDFARDPAVHRLYLICARDGLGERHWPFADRRRLRRLELSSEP